MFVIYLIYEGDKILVHINVVFQKNHHKAHFSMGISHVNLRFGGEVSFIEIIFTC